jgi:hypothetical protein
VTTKRNFALQSKVIVYPGFGAWRFLHVGSDVSRQIKIDFGTRAAGFGSIRVRVCIGSTTWDTSIFPDKKSGTYLLPLKAAIRKKEEIADDDIVSFSVTIA